MTFQFLGAVLIALQLSMVDGVMLVQDEMGDPTMSGNSAQMGAIEADFSAVSNRALLYAGAPNADPKTLRQMRDLYKNALRSIQVLKHNNKVSDATPARKAVDALAEFVNQHPPGLYNPPDFNAYD